MRTYVAKGNKADGWKKEIKGMADIKTEDEETTIAKKPLFSFQMMTKQTNNGTCHKWACGQNLYAIVIETLIFYRSWI